MGTGDFSGRGSWAGLAEVRFDVARERSGGRRLRISPSMGSDGAATFVIAATGVADDQLSGFRSQRIVAVMDIPDAACMRRRGRCREGQRGEVSQERHEQEEFGDRALCDQSMHAELAMLEAYQLAVDEGKNVA